MAKDEDRQYRNTDVSLGLAPQLKCMRISFTKNTSETDTGIDLPGPCIVMAVELDVTTNVASGTIDVGTLSTGTNGDADGFIDGASCATAGKVPLAAGNANTIGVFLEGAEQSGSNTRLFRYFPSTDERSITYTTSNHAIAGDIYIIYVDLSLMEDMPPG